MTILHHEILPSGIAVTQYSCNNGAARSWADSRLEKRDEVCPFGITGVCDQECETESGMSQRYKTDPLVKSNLVTECVVNCFPRVSSFRDRREQE